VNLVGKVALVTGGGIRVGRAISIALADAGMNVAVHYASSAEGAAATATEIRSRGRKAETFPSDLTVRGEPEKLIDAVCERMGGLDVLVNSAAIMTRTPVGAVTYESWDATMALNLRAPFFLSQASCKKMNELSGGGVIINIADLAAFETWSNYIPHSVSKAGVVHMTKSLARALAPTVRVNAIAPGTVLLPEGWPSADAEHLRETTPLKSLGSPQDVTDALLFLLRSDYITGETMIVDGGRHVRG
jgi:Dehydrogenases with different specificities (related to short-chain alcohol dehydrogenases)